MGAGLAPGSQIGSYLLLFRLGEGGMGEVWAAFCQRTGRGPGDLVALKVLKRDRAHGEDVLLFDDEARAASALRHPAIVPTVDGGRDGSTSFLAMELIQGPALTALLQRLALQKRRPNPEVVAYLGIAMGQALDYAYDQAQLRGRLLRLIHRDVSPHNILVDLGGRVRLTDFGVARTAVQDHRSRVGTIRGKPSYMAPEQVLGRDLDDRTDVFALGIVLYECASLTRLFGRKEPLRAMQAVVRSKPPALEERVPGFPKRLARVIHTALEKDPAQRFPSAAAFVDALTDAASTMPAFASARAEMAELVRQSFDSEAFDVTGRAYEGLLAAGIPAPWEVAPEEADDVAPTTVWPTASAPDPLDPEALEVLRTELEPKTEVGSDRTHHPRALAGMRATSTGALVVAAGLLGAAAITIVLTADVLRPTPQTQPRTVVGSGHALGAPQGVKVEALLNAEVAPEAVEALLNMEDDGLRPNPRSGTKRRASKPSRSGRAPPNLDPAGDAERFPNPPKALPASVVAPAATYDEVRALLRRVRARDPRRASALLATLIEAGRTNTRALNRLRTEAERFLRESKPGPETPLEARTED